MLGISVGGSSAILDVVEGTHGEHHEEIEKHWFLNRNRRRRRRRSHDNASNMGQQVKKPSLRISQLEKH